MKANTENNYAWLNAIRGLAAILVLLQHVLGYYSLTTGIQNRIIDFFTFDVLSLGQIGVVLFFMMSGFLTPNSYKKRTKMSFIVNRLFRLYPVYWLALILIGIVFRFDGAGAAKVIANFTMLQIFFGQDDIIGLSWTLPIELILYFLIALFVRYIWEQKKLSIIFALSCFGTILLGVARWYTSKPVPVAIGLLITAALVGHILREYRNGNFSKKFVAMILPAFEITLFITSRLAYGFDAGHSEVWYKYFMDYSVAMLLFVLFLHFNVSNSFFSFVGTISYPLYLLQEFINRVMFTIVWNDTYNITVFMLLDLLLCVAVAILVHYTVENPAVSCDKKVQKLIGKTLVRE